MLHYVIQTIAFQLFFLIIYDVFLKKETFFNWNRFYLLITPVLSLIIPFIKIPQFREVVSQDYIITLPEVFIGNTQIPAVSSEQIAPITAETNNVLWWDFLFFIGMAVVAIVFAFKVLSIIRLILKNPKLKQETCVIVQLLNSASAFSFFNYVFLGEQIHKKEQDAILKHEMVHVTQKHSLDLLFFEVLKIVFWFNPLIYLYQNKIRTLHEFIADAEALKYQDKTQFYQNLLSQAFETKNISFINPFFKQSLIKKRIAMLSKAKSKQISLLKYAILVPLVFGMLIYTSAEAQIKSDKISQSSSEIKNLTDKQLKDKIYKEILEMEKNGATESDILSKYMSHSDKYIISREDYYMDQMWWRYYFLHKKKISEEKVNKSLVSGSYSEYLDYKKTEDAKRDWEYKKMDVMRLVVLDLDNITVEENIRYNSMLKQFHEDDHYTEFVLTDGKSYSTKTKFSKTTKNGTKYFFDKEDLKYSVNIKEVNSDKAARAKLKQLQFKQEIFLKSNPDYVVWVNKSKGKEYIYSLHHKDEVIPFDYKVIDGLTYSGYKYKIYADLKFEEVTKKINVNPAEVPFAAVEQVPIFPGCENVTKAEQKQCVSNGIAKHVNQNFDTNLASQLGLVGKQRINVIFKINKKGHVEGVRSRAPHPALESEAIRVINTLPKMLPGNHKGENVVVPYSLPIIFQVSE